MTKQHWTQEEVRELGLKASSLYSTVVGLTDTPREAAEIICMMHMLLYLNCGDGTSTVDDMLSQYVTNFKTNYEAQIAMEKGQMN